MTTDAGVSAAQATTPRRRPRQAPAGRALATGAALTATGVLVAVMGAAAPAAPAVELVVRPAPAADAPQAAASPPVTIVVIHRSAAPSPATNAVPSAGQAIPAALPRSATPAPAPVATSTAS